MIGETKIKRIPIFAWTPDAAAALQELENTSGLRMPTMPRAKLRGAELVRRARRRGRVVMLVVRPPRRRNRQPLPPSLRLPIASMGRASFLRLLAVWLAAVVAVLVIALAVRWFL